MRLVSLTEAGKELDIPYGTLYYHLLKGHLTTTRVGNVLAVDLDTLQKELEAHGYKPRKEQRKSKTEK